MGKMKISNNKNNQKKGSGWLTLIVVVVLLAVFLTVLSVVVSGIIKKNVPAVESSNYKVNANMLSWYYADSVAEFENSVKETLEATYKNYYSDSKELDKMVESILIKLSNATAPDLESQKKTNFKFGDTTMMDDSIVKAHPMYEIYKNSSFYKDGNAGTWYDFYMANAVESAKEDLMFCEEAANRNIALTEEEIKNINSNIDLIILYYVKGGNKDVALTDDQSLVYYMGMRGVKTPNMTRSDLVETLKIQSLSGKVATDIVEKLEGAITDADLEAEYAEKKKEYDYVDYVHYDFTVNISSDKTDTTEYVKDIEEANALAAELAKSKDIKEFKMFIFNKIAGEKYDSELTAKKLTADDTKGVSDADKATIKSKVIAAAIAEYYDAKEAAVNDVVTSGEGDNNKTYSIYGIALTKNHADAIKAVKEAVFNAVKSADTTYTVVGAMYGSISSGSTLTTEKYKDADGKPLTFNEWLFSDKAAANTIEVFAAGDKLTTKDGKTVLDTTTTRAGYYSTRVTFVIKPQYKNEAKTKDYAYIYFADEAKAKEALTKIEALGSTLTKDTFKKVGEDAKATVGEKTNMYEDRLVLEVGSSSYNNTKFKEWILNAETKPGSYTKTPILVDETAKTYILAYYIGEGEYEWKLDAKIREANDDYEVYVEDMTKRLSSGITVTDWIIDSVGN